MTLAAVEKKEREFSEQLIDNVGGGRSFCGRTGASLGRAEPRVPRERGQHWVSQPALPCSQGRVSERRQRGGLTKGRDFFSNQPPRLHLRWTFFSLKAKVAGSLSSLARGHYSGCWLLALTPGTSLVKARFQFREGGFPPVSPSCFRVPSVSLCSHIMY